MSSRVTWNGLMQCAAARLSFTDGPFAETKEQLAGYLLIEAPDMEAAKEIAATRAPADPSIASAVTQRQQVSYRRRGSSL